MTVEQQFRDTKGRRFGVILFWTQFRDPEALARFMMLLAVALLIWTIAGKVAAGKDPSLRIRSRKKGPRQSYVTIGLRILSIEAIPILLSPSAISNHLELPAFRRIAGARRGGK